MTKGGFFLNGVSIVLIALGMFFYNKTTEKRIAFVKVQKLYDDFQMKKDLEGKFKNTEKARKNILDSLELDLKLITKKLQNESNPDKSDINMYQEKRENYLLKKKQFEEDNSLMGQQYSQQVMKQLNTYVDNYGKEHHYSYILGLDGSPIIMHADDVFDVTNDVLIYVNSKYKGL